MSDDSPPPPPSVTRGPDRTVKYSYFAAIAILSLSSITYSINQIMDSRSELADVTLAVNHLEPQVKQARYEKDKLYSLAKDVLQLAANDSNAAQVVAEYKIQLTQPPQTTMDTSAAPASPSRPTFK